MATNLEGTVTFLFTDVVGSTPDVGRNRSGTGERPAFVGFVTLRQR